MATSGRTFRIFVSSTFSDLVAERNALQERVFPKLRDLCRGYGCRFQAIDLRWGIREEAGYDQQTMKICLNEIARCQRITPRPNFIVLLGDRYGWRPLPPEIEAGEFELLVMAIADPAERALVEAWYVRDDNAVPPVYFLKARTVPAAAGAGEEERRRALDDEARRWDDTERGLRRILAAAAGRAGLAPAALSKYVASATEQEIEAGALGVPGSEGHVFGFFRTIEGLPGGPGARAFVDLDADGRPDLEARSRLEGLKARLRARLGANVHDGYTAAWRDGTISTDHLDRFCDDVLASLSRVMLAEMKEIAEMDPVEAERAGHEAFGRERARFFFGRYDALARIDDYLAGSGGAPLGLFGASGSGKSALMARAVERAREGRPGAVLAARFLGATPASGDVRSLLETLCREITRAYGGDEAAVPADFRELCAAFAERLALARPDKPLVVFLDALDQLSSAHNGPGLAWLPAALPEHVRMVASTAPGESGDALRQKLPADGHLDLKRMTPVEGGRLLEAWLEDAGRALRKDQTAEVLGKFRPEGLPLFLKLAFEEARLWRSDAVPIALAPDVAGLVRQMFARLAAEINHGRTLVSRALAYLRAAKNGLSEDEIVDVLSRDEAVVGDFEKRAFFRPPESRLPVVVWSRFYLDLEPYLNLRQADGARLLSFFHRQMAEVAEAEFLAGPAKAAAHARLAEYFDGQPLFVERDGARTANLRKLAELPFQQAHAGLWKDLERTLTDFEFLEAKCTHAAVVRPPGPNGEGGLYGGVYELIEDYQRALDLMPEDD